MVKVIYNAVKRQPAIKLCLKNAYQAINILLSGKKTGKNKIYSIAENYFFGFHDKCPWDIDDRRILAHKAPLKELDRINGVPVEIGYFKDDSLSCFTPLGTTRAWNWQQGAMLQWDPLSDAIYFNDIQSGFPQLVKLRIGGAERESIYPASASISPDGRLSAAISFYRFGKGLPGYGYCGILENEGEISIPKKNGSLKVFDIINKENHPFQEIHILQCIEQYNLKSMNSAYHYISHPQFSPDSKKLAFFHRWVHKGRRVETHLFFLDLETSVLNPAYTGSMFSHFCWIDNERIFGFYEDINGNDYYGILNINGTVEIKLDWPLLSVDGHPNAHLRSGKIVTDTYPDKRRLQNLFIVKDIFRKIECEKIGAFYAPFKFQEIFRADLHPRWNRAGNKIAVDCSFTGKRSLAIVQAE